MAKEFPKLPYNMNPELIYEFGELLVAYVKDGHYDLLFYWDRIGVSFYKVEVKLNFNEYLK